MRLFIGIPLSAAVTRELTAVSMRLRSKDDGLRWSAPESWHITLQFLGNTSQEKYAGLVDRLGELRSPPAPIQLSSLGFFERAGVFFAGIELTPELIALQQQVKMATSLCGFPAEARAYRPHITLARSKGKEGGRGMRRLRETLHQQPRFTKFTAREFLLYESHLSPSGSQYEVRERFAFSNILTI